MDSLETEQDVKLFIGGVWRDGSAGRRIAIDNPATGMVVGHVAHAEEDDLAEATEAARNGLTAWQALGPFNRSRILRAAAALLNERKAEIAMMLTMEQGKPLAQASAEVVSAVEALEWYADEGRRAYGRTVPSRVGGAWQLVAREPVGPVLCIAPWNFPLSLVARKIGPALAAGCSVIIKPTEEAPSAPSQLIKALEDAGVPAGVVNLVFGKPSAISDYLIRHPAIRKVSFTGSTNVGRQLSSLAGQYMKRMTMELGGHAPAIICPDADVQRAADVMASFKFRNAGQVCTAPTRLMVHSSIFDQFVERFLQTTAGMKVGNGIEEGIQIGPLASARRVDAIETLVDDARSKGATLEVGGCRIGNVGYFYEPTVLLGVPTEARIMNEEPFGPVAIINRFNNIDDAVVEANRLDYGLAAYAFTPSASTARYLGDSVRCGKFSVNDPVSPFIELPMGGVKDSGYGVEGGSEGMGEFLTNKLISFA